MPAEAETNVVRLIPRGWTPPPMPDRSPELALVTAILAAIGPKARKRAIRKLMSAVQECPDDMNVRAALNFIARV